MYRLKDLGMKSREHDFTRECSEYGERLLPKRNSRKVPDVGDRCIRVAKSRMRRRVIFVLLMSNLRHRLRCSWSITINLSKHPLRCINFVSCYRIPFQPRYFLSLSSEIESSSTIPFKQYQILLKIVSLPFEPCSIQFYPLILRPLQNLGKVVQVNRR
jgi:hypothetical protein